MRYPELRSDGCHLSAIKGLIKEGGETTNEDADPIFKGLALITAAQKVEHYEISVCLRVVSKALGLTKLTELFKATDEK